MKKRWRLILLFGVGAILAWLVSGMLRPREASWQGKPLSYWLPGFDYSAPLDRQNAAREAVRQIGTNALPALVPMLCATDSRFKLKLMTLLAKQSLVKFPFTRAEDRRLRALRAFHTLGPIAKPAIPSLAQMLDSEVGANDAALALVAIGPASENVLVRALGNVHPNTRAVAAGALGRLCSDPEMVVSALIKSLQDAVPMVRAGAAKSLGEIHHKPDFVVPALLITLNDPEAEVRSYSAEALGRFRLEAKTALPALLQALRDRNAEVRNVALSAIEKIDASAVPIVQQ